MARFSYLTACYAVLYFCLCPAIAAEQIELVSTEIIIEHDRSLTVTETVKALNEGVNLKHGLVRILPARYKDRLGEVHNVEYKIERAENINPKLDLPRTEKTYGDFHVIMLGGRDTDVPNGLHTFAFKYRVRGYIDTAEQFDYFSWPVTGYFYKVSVKKAEITVRFPELVHPKGVIARGYTQRIEKGEGLTIAEYLEMTKDKVKIKKSSDSNKTNTAVKLWTIRKLEPREVFVASVKWPAGFITKR